MSACWQQLPIIRELVRLEPPGGAHRQRLLRQLSMIVLACAGLIFVGTFSILMSSEDDVLVFNSIDEVESFALGSYSFRVERENVTAVSRRIRLRNQAQCKEVFAGPCRHMSTVSFEVTVEADGAYELRYFLTFSLGGEFMYRAVRPSGGFSFNYTIGKHVLISRSAPVSDALVAPSGSGLECLVNGDSQPLPVEVLQGDTVRQLPLTAVVANSSLTNVVQRELLVIISLSDTICGRMSSDGLFINTTKRGPGVISAAGVAVSLAGLMFTVLTCVARRGFYGSRRNNDEENDDNRSPNSQVQLGEHVQVFVADQETGEP